MSKKKNEELKQDPSQEEVRETQAASEEELPQQETVPMAEYEKLQAERDELQDKYMRLAAEYDNFRKRSQKEREGLFSDAKGDALAAMLPVYDNVERALKQPCSDEAYYKGVELIMRQLEETFQKLGVKEIEAQGVPFDPNLHNAVMHVEDDSLGEGIVAEVFQKGFMIGDKVARFAMVKVAN